MVQSITSEQLHTLKQSGRRVFLLDVRSPEEFREGHIPGSYSLPLKNVDPDVVKDLLVEKGFSLQDPVYVTCASGPRAIKACELLDPHFREVYHLLACLKGWMSKGYAIEKGSGGGTSLES